VRAALGLVLILQGKIDLADQSDPSIGIWVAGLLAMAAGVLLLAGFLTPLAAGLVVLRTTGALFVIPAFSLSLFTSKPSIAFLCAIAVCIVFLGPGSFSVDSRLFGLREVIIPLIRTTRQELQSDDSEDRNDFLR